MKSGKVFALAAAVATGVTIAAMAVLPQTASAQTMYRCKAPNGSAVLSDRPCPGEPLPTTTPIYRSQPLSSSRRYDDDYRLPDHYAHMSAGCQQIHDAIRTGPSRGLKAETLHGLRKEWVQKCSEDEAIAYRRLREERRQAYSQRLQDEKAEQTQLEAEERRRAQCGEMRLSLSQRRARMDAMTPGERADLERFEKNYTTRCM